MEVEMAQKQDTCLKNLSNLRNKDSEVERQARWSLRKKKRMLRRKERIILREAEATEERERVLKVFKAKDRDHLAFTKPSPYYAALLNALKEKQIRREQRLQRSRSNAHQKAHPVEDICAASQEMPRRSLPNLEIFASVYGRRSMSQPVQISPNANKVSIVKSGQNYGTATRKEAQKHGFYGVCSEKLTSQLSKSQSVHSSCHSVESEMRRSEQDNWEALLEKRRIHLNGRMSGSLSPNLPDVRDGANRRTDTLTPRAEPAMTECPSCRNKWHSCTEKVPAPSVSAAVETNIPFHSPSINAPEQSKESRLVVEKRKEVSTRVPNPFYRQGYSLRAKHDKILSRLPSPARTQAVQVIPPIQKGKRRFEESNLSDKSPAIATKRQKIKVEPAPELIDLSD